MRGDKPVSADKVPVSDGSLVTIAMISGNALVDMVGAERLAALSNGSIDAAQFFSSCSTNPDLRISSSRLRSQKSLSETRCACG